MSMKDKLKTVAQAMGEIEKQFGRGAIMWLGGESSTVQGSVSVIPSGSVGVDRALGVGGLPRGRIVEVFGPESSGKTTFALHAIAEVQKLGGIAAFIDAEHALDPRYARSLGIDLERLLVSQPDSGEQALEICESLVRSSAVDLIVVDSVAALVPKAELEGSMGDAHVGLQARLMSQAMRKLTGQISKTGSSILFINQTRQKIGVMFGSPETTTGGTALKFYASVRLEVRRIGTVKDGEVVTGSRVRAKVVKNKLAPPFREAEFDIMYGGGISTACELLDMGVERGLVEKSGAWYSLLDTRIGQGRERSRVWLEQRPVLMERLRTALLSEDLDRSVLGSPTSWEPEATPEGDSSAAKPDAPVGRNGVFSEVSSMTAQAS
ncbi:MAG: recombinase RecA [Deltaproteobacteria bacterium]|nr:recombinase RecA [Deltaproteobacteria bacterium]